LTIHRQGAPNGNVYSTDLKLHIDGERLGAAGRATHRVINPATGATLGELPLASPADLIEPWTRQRAAIAMARRSAADRSRVLAGAAHLLRQRIDKIAAVATMERQAAR